MNTTPDQKNEPYATIKELSFMLETDHLPSSRDFINKFRGRVKFVCNRAKYSELKAAVESYCEFKRPRKYKRKLKRT